MAGDLISLSRARKAKARSARAAEAANNRVRFGRTKAEKSLAKDKAGRARRLIDGHERAGE